MDTAGFLQHLESQDNYSGRMVHIEHIPNRRAKYAELSRPLSTRLQHCLDRHKLFPLYRHQAEAANYAFSGENVMVATFSASGKTLCYNIPVMEW